MYWHFLFQYFSIHSQTQLVYFILALIKLQSNREVQTNSINDMFDITTVLQSGILYLISSLIPNVGGGPSNKRKT